MSLRTWGLEIGSKSVKAVEVTRTWRGPRVTNYGAFPLAGKDKEELRREKIRALREILPKLGKDGEEVFVAFPSNRTMVHRVPLPFRDRKKNERVLKFEAEPLLPFPIDRLVVDFAAPEKKLDGKGALVFAVQKEDLGDQISLMREAGLDPGTIVPESLPLFWLARRLGLTSNQNGCLLDLGSEKATVIIWQGDFLASVRSIPAPAGMAGARGPEREARLSPPARGDSPEEGLGGNERPDTAALGRMAEEVRRTLLSHECGPGAGPVEKIYLTGGMSGAAGLETSLGELLEKPVSYLDPGGASSPFPREVPKELRPALAVALGAALGGPRSEGINFRKEEFSSSQKARKAKTRVRLLLAYASALALLAIFSFGLDLFLQERRVQGLKKEIRKEFSAAVPEAKKVVNEVQQLRARVGEEKARLASLGGTSGAGHPLEILRDLSGMADPAWKMRITELMLDPDSLEVNGEAGSFDAVNQLKTHLERSSRYREVQLKTARASGLENVIEFKFQMKRGSGE